jgi:hypothetical protein
MIADMIWAGSSRKEKLVTVVKVVSKGFSYALFPMLLLALILTLYWSFTLGKSMPTGDGAIPLSFYSYLYSGYMTYGKYFLWNPFLIGGAINNVMVYIYMGFSPLNPILHIWFPISSFLRIGIIQSFYIYYLLHIFMAAYAAYLIGLNFFFKNKASAIFFPLLLALSGYYVSMMGLFYFIVPYSWFVVVLYLGLKAITSGKLTNYFLLGLATSLYVINGPTVVIHGAICLVIFFSSYFIMSNKDAGLWAAIKKHAAGISLFVLTTVLLVAIPLILYARFVNTEGYHYTETFATFFFGRYEPPEPSIKSMDFFILLNTFIPNPILGFWKGYGTYWYNGFYYLGFITPVLVLFGLIYLASKKELRNILLALSLSFLFSTLYSQGHALIKLIPALNLLTKYPKFGEPMVLLDLIIVAAFGFHALFCVDDDKKPKQVSVRNFTRSVLGLLTLTAVIILGVIITYYTNLFTSGGPVALQKPDLTPWFSTMLYCIFIGALYFVPVVMKNKWLFTGVLVFDLLFFLSSSKPLVESPNIPTKSDKTALTIDAKQKFTMPVTINYATSSSYPGMHFAVGPTLYRETAIPKIYFALMNSRRAYWKDATIEKVYTDTSGAFNALNGLGVSRKRFFFADSVYKVKSYADIDPALNQIYRAYDTALGGRPLFTNEPVVISESELPVLNNSKPILPDKNLIPTYTKDVKNYVISIAKTIPTQWKDTILYPKDFTLLQDNEGNGIKLFKYTGTLPQYKGLVTENNTIEHLCITISDQLGTTYYPVSSDIFNFTLDGGPDSSYRYMVSYRNFFATYMTKSDGLSLYVVTPRSTPFTSLKLSYPANCGTAPEYDNGGALVKKSIIIKKGQLAYDKFENGRLVFTSSVPAQEGIPAIMGAHITGVKVHELPDGPDLDKFYDTTLADISYSIDAGILKIYKAPLSGPFLDTDFEVQYYAYDTNLYDNKNELEIASEEPDDIKILTHKSSSSILVTRNIYSTDWTATIDSKKTGILIINGLYMGVTVPAGNHTVTFSYNPLYLKQLTKLSPIIYILIPLLIVVFGKLGFPNLIDLLRKRSYGKNRKI